MTGFNLAPLLPEIFLAIAGMGLLIVGVSQGNTSTRVICWATSLAFAITVFLLLGLSWEPRVVLNGMFVFDEFAGFMKLIILVGLIASLAISVRYLQQEGIERFEYPILMAFAGVGMMMMVSSSSLLSLYMGLELQSLSLCVLAAFHRNSLKSSEAGIKYFVLGALSSGMLLFGISLIYGYTGSVDYQSIAASLELTKAVPLGVTFGLVFILAGWPLRFPPRRSTCGRPTCIKAPRPALPPSSLSCLKSLRWVCSCACCSIHSGRRRRNGSRLSISSLWLQ
jgi:NADH-quinone oxidoreductase subunit N